MRLDLEGYAQALQSELDEVCVNVKLELFNGIIRDTRVDTGRLRGNWQTSTGQPILSDIDRLDPTQQGTDGGAAQSQVAAVIKPFADDYISNNLPYAEVWDNVDGRIDANFARIDRNIQEAIAGGR